MVFTILGSGTSTGVPLIHCRCRVCRSKNPRNKRLRVSAWVQKGGKSLLIDTSPDLRQQAMRAKIGRVDAVLFTHPHADHVAGIDELRSYNYAQRSSIPVYGNDWSITELERRFSYIFSPGPVEGGGIPQLIPHRIRGDDPQVRVAGISVTPISTRHGSQETLGYRIGSVAYVVDCSYIPPESLQRMKGLSVLFLDCVRLKPHGTHLHLDRALEVAAEVGAERTFLTHLGHDFDDKLWNKKLPRGVRLAYDGLTVSLRA